MKRFVFATFFIAYGAVLTGASAQNTYRCGNTYSQSPCPGGALVESEDTRSSEQRNQTRQAAERDAKAATALEKDRSKQDSKAATAYIPPSSTQSSTSASKPAAKKTIKPDTFTAVEPKKPRDPKAKKPKKTKKK